MNRHFATLSLLSLAIIACACPAEASRPRPPRPPRHPREVARHVLDATPAPREVTSDLCATTVRAEADALRHLKTNVQEWLSDSGVDRSWAPPQRLVDRMVMGKPAFEPVKVKDLDVVRATITADFSEAHKREFLEVYHRQIGGRRLAVLGGGLAVVLVGLAALSGYIRADEATKGYYTKRLGLVAAAGVGAAGVIVYRVLT